MKPKHTRTLCKGCVHGLEHHPDRGACTYGRNTVTGGCMCPAFNTPKDKIPEAKETIEQLGELIEKAGGRLTLFGKPLGGDPAFAGVAAEIERLRLELQAALDKFSAGVLRVLHTYSVPKIVTEEVRASGGSLAATEPPIAPRPAARRPKPEVPAPTAGKPEETPPASAPPQGVSPRTPHPAIFETRDGHDEERELGVGERQTLAAIGYTGERGCTDSKLAVVTGYKPTSRRTFLQRLTARGFVETFLLGDVKRYRWTPAGKAEHERVEWPMPERGTVIRDLPAGEAKCFEAIARRPNGCSNTVLAIATKYRDTSIRTYLQRLAARELVHTCDDEDSELDGLHFLTPAAKEEIAAAKLTYTPITGAELRAKLLEDLPEGERLIFGILVKAAPAPMGREELGEIADYKETSIRTYLQRLAARKVITYEDAGHTLAEELRG